MADHFVDWFNFFKSAAQRVEDQSFFAALDDSTYQHFGTDLYFITDQRGYAHVVQCIGKDFLDSAHPRLNTRVTSVHHSDRCVCALTVIVGHRRPSRRRRRPLPAPPTTLEDGRHSERKVWPLHQGLYALQ